MILLLLSTRIIRILAFNMGGCRCTYRNCVVKSDGKTHMFHYPVFEKVRCHHWLVNAQKLEFLNLKVSQVKNRVVCQHHFKDENFMNYKKDKLTFDAIPTENGPFCDPSKFLDNHETVKEYPDMILLEDIENDFIFNDKKANFSLKYSDFLTNNELIDSNSHCTSKDINLTKENTVGNLNSRFSNNDKMLLDPSFRALNTKLTLPIKNTKTSQPMLVVPPYSKLNTEIKINNKLKLETIPSNVPDSSQNVQDVVTQNTHIDLHLKPNNSVIELNKEQYVQKEPKVKILSEQKICGPMALNGKFEKKTPSVTMNLTDKFPIMTKVEYDQESTKKATLEEPDKPSGKLKVLEVLDVEFDLSQPKSNSVQKAHMKISADQNIDASNKSPSKKQVQIKNKVNPERVAAIEKKRKFNMKLKDIIESCLDKLDDPVKASETQLINKGVNEKEAITKNINDMIENTFKKPEEQKSLPLAKESSPQDNIVAYLETRMKNMEHTLLNKIENNTQKIVELKNSFENTNKRKPQSKTRCVSSQTDTNEHSYKKFLYQEISKYLSHSSNSLIYEELFINKYAPDEPRSLLKRKRKKCI